MDTVLVQPEIADNHLKLKCPGCGQPFLQGLIGNWNLAVMIRRLQFFCDKHQRCKKLN